MLKKFLTFCINRVIMSPSHTDAIADVLKRYDLKFHYINSNPECPSTELCDFSEKFYFNVLLDDKAAFVEKDWETIKTFLEVQYGTKI